MNKAILWSCLLVVLSVSVLASPFNQGWQHQIKQEGYFQVGVNNCDYTTNSVGKLVPKVWIMRHGEKVCSIPPGNSKRLDKLNVTVSSDSNGNSGDSSGDEGSNDEDSDASGEDDESPVCHYESKKVCSKVKGGYNKNGHWNFGWHKSCHTIQVQVCSSI
jgi:hypothetical protein